MFLTGEQVEQLQSLCEDVAGSKTRSGRITIVIRNNMPRVFEVEKPVLDDYHVEIGAVKRIIRVALPEEELRKKRQRNRMKPMRNAE